MVLNFATFRPFCIDVDELAVSAGELDPIGKSVIRAILVVCFVDAWFILISFRIDYGLYPALYLQAEVCINIG